MIYFIQAEMLGLVKIGTTTNMKSRLKALRDCCPDKLRILGSFKSTDDRLVERILHRKFESARSHGEWFRQTPDLMAFIERFANKWRDEVWEPCPIGEQMYEPEDFTRRRAWHTAAQRRRLGDYDPKAPIAIERRAA